MSDGVYKALSDPTRRHILRLLRDRDRTAGEIAEHFDLSKPTMSGHFAVLRHAGLIEGRRRGTTITYRLNVSVLEEAMWGLMDALRIDRSTKEKSDDAHGDDDADDHGAGRDGAGGLGVDAAAGRRKGADPLGS